MIELLGFGIGWLIGKSKLFHRDYPEPKGIFDSDEEFVDFIKLLKLKKIEADRRADTVSHKED